MVIYDIFAQNALDLDVSTKPLRSIRITAKSTNVSTEQCPKLTLQ